MHPFALVLLVVLCASVLLGSRVAAAAALIAGASLMTMGQVVVVGPFDFYFYRLVILTGLVRVVIRGESSQFSPNKIDVAILVWSVILLLTSIGHDAQGATFVNGLGTGFSTAVVYLVFRFLLRNLEDVIAVTKWLIAILLVLAVAMLMEKVTGQSAWEPFGAVSTLSRNDRIRAIGPFRHPILAGSVGAALVPMLAALSLRQRLLAAVGILACLVITVASASSGPVVALASGLCALGLWRYRKYRRRIVWIAVAGLGLLQLTMKANVWYLIARVDLAGGSTGWHRAYLIEQALSHLGEWWLSGTDFTRHWMPTGVSWSPDHSDITNHYVRLGVSGGLGLLAAHVCVLALAFRSVGRILGRYPEAPADQRLLVWSLGAVLFGHTINSLGIAYFDQSVVFVYFILACISSLDAYPNALVSSGGAATEVRRQPMKHAEPIGPPSGTRTSRSGATRRRQRWRQVLPLPSTGERGSRTRV